MTCPSVFSILGGVPISVHMTSGFSRQLPEMIELSMRTDAGESIRSNAPACTAVLSRKTMPIPKTTNPPDAYSTLPCPTLVCCSIVQCSAVRSPATTRIAPPCMNICMVTGFEPLLTDVDSRGQCTVEMGRDASVPWWPSGFVPDPTSSYQESFAI